MEKIKSKNLTPDELEEEAKKNWKNYLHSNKSIIVDIFQGQIKSQISCDKCEARSDTFDPVMYFSIPFPEKIKSRQVFNLEELFHLYTDEERVDGLFKCESCNVNGTIRKKIDIWKAPDILIIHLKRFKFKDNTFTKIKNKVDYPVDSFSLTPFVKSYQRTKPIYKLFAVCVNKSPK